MTLSIDDLILPGQPESTPQKLPRRPARLWRRDRLDIYTPEHAATIDSIARGIHPVTFAALPMVLPSETRDVLGSHLGYAYGFWDRCGGTHHEHDCSGYICWAANMLGLAFGCVSSFTIAQWCWDAGLIISEEEARATDGTLALRGPNGARGPSQRNNGADGHIVACYLPSTGGTYEAMGHAYGVRRGTLDGRVWNAFAKWPGVHFGPPPPPPFHLTQERDMIVQRYHYDAGARPHRIPDRFESGPRKGQWCLPTISVAADGQSLDLRDGASVVGGGKLNGDDQFVPAEKGARHIVGVAEWHPHEGTPGIVVKFDSGPNHPYRFT